MMSGVYKNALHRKEALERYGAAAFVEKPFRIAALQQALKRALGARYPSRREPVAAEEPSASDSLAGDEAIQEGALVEKAAGLPPSEQAIRGDLSRTAFPEVLAQIYRRKGTGALLLRREKVKKIVYFRNGVPCFVKSNLLSECLGRVMVRERMISEAQCEESLRRMKASRRQQGTVLMEMACISPHNLAYALNLQLRAKLFDIFSWSGGEYSFDSTTSVPPETVNLELTPAQAIYEGVRRAYGADRLGAALGPAARQYVHPAADALYALQELGLGEEEHELLRHVDGRKTVAELRSLGILAPLDCDRLVYAMRCAQALELRPERAPESSGPGIFSAADLPPEPPEMDVTEDVTIRVPLPVPGHRPAKQAAPPRRADAAPRDRKAHEREAPPPRAPPPRAPTREIPEAVIESGPHPVLPELSGKQHAEEDESMLRERLAAKVAAMRKMNHFEILGVRRGATAKEISSAYVALARENHPDRVSGSTSAEVRELASQILFLISSAHDALADPKERKRYEEQLASGQKPPPPGGAEVGRILSAEAKFQKGEEQMRLGVFDEAHALFREAVELYPEEGEFHAYLGWSRFRKDPEDPRAMREAIDALERAVGLNPKSEKAYLFSGHVHKAAGNKEMAQKQFEKAIQVNPGCKEALEELSLLDWAGRPGGSR